MEKVLETKGVHLTVERVLKVLETKGVHSTVERVLTAEKGTERTINKSSCVPGENINITFFRGNRITK